MTSASAENGRRSASQLERAAEHHRDMADAAEARGDVAEADLWRALAGDIAAYLDGGLDDRALCDEPALFALDDARLCDTPSAD